VTRPLSDILGDTNEAPAFDLGEPSEVKNEMERRTL